MNPLRLASILFTLILLTLGMPIFWRAVATTEKTTHEAIQPMADPPSTLTKADPVTRARVNESYGKLSLSFEPNRGQVDGQVKFLSRGRGYSLSLTSTEASWNCEWPKGTRGLKRSPAL